MVGTALGADVDVGEYPVVAISPGWVTGREADVRALACGTGKACEVVLIPIRLCEGDIAERELGTEGSGLVVVTAD